MTSTNIDTVTPASDVVALTALRSLATASPDTDAFAVADRQAALLHDLFPGPADQLPAYLSTLIPSIRVDYLDTLPAQGISFWTTGQWRIHVRTNDPADVQAFTVLHELKHIIDHPLRRGTTGSLGNLDWEAVADHFAARVLSFSARRVTASATGRVGHG